MFGKRALGPEGVTRPRIVYLWAELSLSLLVKGGLTLCAAALPCPGLWWDRALARVRAVALAWGGAAPRSGLSATCQAELGPGTSLLLRVGAWVLTAVCPKQRPPLSPADFTDLAEALLRRRPLPNWVTAAESGARAVSPAVGPVPKDERPAPILLQGLTAAVDLGLVGSARARWSGLWGAVITALLSVPQFVFGSLGRPLRSAHLPQEQFPPVFWGPGGPVDLLAELMLDELPLRAAGVAYGLQQSCLSFFAAVYSATVSVCV